MSILLICIIGVFSYKIGLRSANMQVKDITPKQLAEAMLGDHFYSDNPSTMLLVSGKVSSVSNQYGNTLVEFQTTTKPSVLPKVTCDFKNAVSIKKGETIRILTMAYAAKREHTADVVLQNCYLVNNTSNK